MATTAELGEARAGATVAYVIEVIEKYQSMPFSYGVDCCAFAGECVESLIGVNPMEGFSYDDEKSANALISRYGDLYAAMVYRLGPPDDRLADDSVCCVRMENGQYIAGVIWRGRAIVRTPGNIMDWPLESVEHSWEIRCLKL